MNIGNRRPHVSPMVDGRCSAAADGGVGVVSGD